MGNLVRVSATPSFVDTRIMSSVQVSAQLRALGTASVNVEIIKKLGAQLAEAFSTFYVEHKLFGYPVHLELGLASETSPQSLNTEFLAILNVYHPPSEITDYVLVRRVGSAPVLIGSDPDSLLENPFPKTTEHVFLWQEIANTFLERCDAAEFYANKRCEALLPTQAFMDVSHRSQPGQKYPDLTPSIGSLDFSLASAITSRISIPVCVHHFGSVLIKDIQSVPKMMHSTFSAFPPRPGEYERTAHLQLALCFRPFSRSILLLCSSWVHQYR